MPKPVSLREIVDALEMQSDEHVQFLDPTTGEVLIVDGALLREAEAGDDEPDLPEWQRQEWKEALRILEGDCIKLPTKFEVHEWQMMRDFAEEVESERIRGELLGAVHGDGAFRHFKSAVHRNHIEKAWYAFRDAALRQIAIDWCEKHGLQWHEGSPEPD